MDTPPASPRRDENKILAALDDALPPGFRSQLERVSLPQGEVVYEPSSEIEHVYFPETAVFSMLSTMSDGSTIEVGPVGDEGMTGLAIYFGENMSLTRVIVHITGSAMRLKANALREELRDDRSAVGRLLLRYTQMLLNMTGQTAACNKLHTLDQQLVRWLLTMHNYVEADELFLTHELMALTLGVRRAGVTGAAGDLRDAGIIEYSRGHIQILDRQALRARACECYDIIRDEYKRVYADLPRLAK